MADKGDIKLKFDYSDLFHGLDRYHETVPYAAADAGRKIAHDGLGKMIQAAPVLTGYLRGSASAHVNGDFIMAGPPPDEGAQVAVTGEVPQGKKPSATVILFGFNAHYAARRHELDEPGTRGGGGKYVERVLLENTQRWMQWISESIARAQGYAK